MSKKSYAVTIAGGGSTFTPGIALMLLKEHDRFPVDKVVFYDNNAERQEIVAKACEIYFKENAPELDFSYTTDPEEAFTVIDFVLAHIRVGLYAMREQDEKIPLKYGCVGQETCGAGGIAYGMRSIGGVIEILDYMEKYSPDAWMLNYSNPAAIVAEATKRVFPGDKRIINICDMPVGIMNQYADELGVPRNQIEPRYFGLNHFGWFTAVLDKDTGEDYLPRLREIFSQDLPEDAFSDIDASWSETFHFMRKMVRECPEGMLPNTYLQYYLYRDHMLSIEDPEHTRADQVLEGHEKQTFEMIEEVVAAGKLEGTKYAFTLEDLKDDDHATYIADLAYALSHNTHDIFLCMTENTGIVSNLTEGMMVEVPCMVGTNGVEPLNVGEIPTFQKGLLENQYAYEKLTADAALEGSYRKALDALTLNRLVGDTDLARALLDDYIEANKGYWPELS